MTQPKEIVTIHLDLEKLKQFAVEQIGNPIVSKILDMLVLNPEKEKDKEDVSSR